MRFTFLILGIGCRCVNAPQTKPQLKEESFVSCWPAIAAIPLPKTINRTDARLKSKSLLVLDKASHRIMHYANGQLTLDQDGLHCWTVNLGSVLKGEKKTQANSNIPEGWYRTSNRTVSKYHGVIQIHSANDEIDKGEKNDTPVEDSILIISSTKENSCSIDDLQDDRTDGCITMKNEHIDRLRMLMPEQMQSEILILPNR